MKPIHHAAQQGDVSALKTILDEFPALLEDPAQDCTPLGIAVANERFEAADFLISKGAKLTSADLARTIDPSRLHVIKYIVAHGVKPAANCLDSHVEKWCHPNFKEDATIEIMHYLMENGNELDIGVASRALANALFPHDHSGCPVKGATMRVARLLLEHGANPNVLCRSGASLLYVAAYEGRTEVAELLKEFGGSATPPPPPPPQQTTPQKATGGGTCSAVAVLITSGFIGSLFLLAHLLWR